MRNFFAYIVYLLVLLLTAIVRRLPRSLFFFLAPGFAWAAYCLPNVGGIARMNVRVAFPEKTEKERCRIVRKSLENLFISICEFFWCKGKKGVVVSLMDFPEQTTRDVEKGRGDGRCGALFLTPHMGNWEFAGITLGSGLGFRLGTVVRSPRNPYLDRLITSGRMVENVEIIHSKGAVRTIARALKDGKSIGILIDQNTRLRDGGAFVQFFGLPVPVSMTPAHFARKDNRFIAVGAAVRVGKRFRAVLRTVSRPASEYASDEELTQELMNITMGLIREYPEQYLWLYRRFQNIPPDAPEELKKKYPAYASVPGEKFFSRAYKYHHRHETEKE
ncbi:MAG: hypothetical protein J5944_00535 [Lentisphaeria bacterium]|nr:hypothetical protein [Lentisphaeria bacterium]